MKAKFKVGDKVRILDNCRSIDNYTGGYNSDMESKEGKIVTIKKVEYRYPYFCYRMEEVDYLWDERGLELVSKECIVIYRKGNETIALDKTTGAKAVVTCSPDDTYSFYTGAEIAIKRLLGIPVSNPGKPEYRIGDILKITGENYGKARYKEGEGDNGIARVLYEEEYVVLENYQPEEPQKKEFKPHLMHGSKHYGNIGELTLLRDIVGRPLKVGDTVELYNEENELKGEKVVVYHNEYDKAFIMGIEFSCKKDGTIVNGWKIVKKREHTEVAHGEKVGKIEYIKEEPKSQLYNGKVVCVENSKGNEKNYTVGKVYEFKDGQLTTDKGNKLPTFKRMTSFEEWQSFTASKFIELV